jgi:hypothetical protein
MPTIEKIEILPIIPVRILVKFGNKEDIEKDFGSFSFISVTTYADGSEDIELAKSAAGHVKRKIRQSGIAFDI